MHEHLAFIGGGNMACAMISGLQAQGLSINKIDVVEPFAEARERLKTDFGIAANTVAGDFLERATIVIWAVKPQSFKDRRSVCWSCSTLAWHDATGCPIKQLDIVTRCHIQKTAIATTIARLVWLDL